MNFTSTPRKLLFFLLLNFVSSSFIFAQSTSWIGGTNSFWTASANWTNGVPNQGLDAIIGDASFTGSYHPELNGFNHECKSLTIGNDSITSTLDILEEITVYGDVLIGSNGTILHDEAVSISLEGNWSNTGTYSGTDNNAEIILTGPTATINDSTLFKILTVDSGTTLTLAANIEVDRDLFCFGVIDPTINYQISGGADLAVEFGGSIIVHTDTIEKNYSIADIVFDAGGEVQYVSSSVDQLISADYKYGILRLSGGTTKYLNDNLDDMHEGASPRGAVFVDSGVFDLNEFRLKRESTGGTFFVGRNSEVHIGGDKPFPERFSTVTLDTTSIVQYDGRNQDIANLAYGNLILSGETGNATKDLPAGDLLIAGYFVVTRENSTSHTVNAGGNIFVDGYLAIKDSCLFEASTYTHTFRADFTNEGELMSSGTLILSPGSPYSTAAQFHCQGDTFCNTGTVEISGAAPITLIDTSYYFTNLVVSNTHSTGINAPDGSSWSILGDFDITTGSKFDLGTSTTFIIDGNLTNDGELLKGTAQLVFTGDSATLDGLGEINLEDVEIDNGTVLDLNRDIKIYSDLVVDGSIGASSSILEFAGSDSSIISGSTSEVTIENLTSGKTSGSKTILNVPVTISGNLEMTGGQIVTDLTNILTIEDDATASAGIDTSYVVGPMKKIGNNAFVFPIGDSYKWARLGISAPSNNSDEFIAQYHLDGYTDSTTMASTPGPALNNVSGHEYWTCNRNAGSSNITIELFWENSYTSYIDSANSDLKVAKWNGTAWENAGNSNVQGNAAGSVTSNTISSFDVFTFGSLSMGYNYLPVELLEFTATATDKNTVDLKWSTATEVNNKHFEIEHSTDGLEFYLLETVDKKCSPNNIQRYSAIDRNPVTGTNLYRLKQVDMDGTSTYLGTRKVELKKPIYVSLYPNPVSNVLNIESANDIDELVVLNSLGQEVEHITSFTMSASLNLSDYEPGVYFIEIKTGDGMELFQVFKK